MLFENNFPLLTTVWHGICLSLEKYRFSSPKKNSSSSTLKIVDQKLAKGWVLIQIKQAYLSNLANYNLVHNTEKE